MATAIARANLMFLMLIVKATPLFKACSRELRMERKELGETYRPDRTRYG